MAAYVIDGREVTLGEWLRELRTIALEDTVQPLRPDVASLPPAPGAFLYYGSGIPGDGL